MVEEQERDYLRRRLLEETRAALDAPSTAATTIHVRIAIHFARQLASEQAG